MLKKNDFIEIEYTGTIKDEEMVFDTTDEKVAKDNGIHNEKVKYGPVTVCIGQGQTIPGLDSQLEGKEIGKDYTVEVPPEGAFGKKDPKLVQLIATSKFKKANINPMPGLQVNIDEQIGIIKTVSGGRTLVDFNHPLSGKDVVYKVKILGAIEDNNKKLSSLLGALLQIEDPIVKVEGEKAEVTLAFDVPPEVQDVLKKKVFEILPAIKELIFKKKEEKTEAKPIPKPEAKPAEEPKNEPTPEQPQQ